MNADELSAVAEESVAEFSKAAFSKLKITGLLKVIGETVQVMGAAPEAYKVLKAHSRAPDRFDRSDKPCFFDFALLTTRGA